MPSISSHSIRSFLRKVSSIINFSFVLLTILLVLLTFFVSLIAFHINPLLTIVPILFASGLFLYFGLRKSQILDVIRGFETTIQPDSDETQPTTFLQRAARTVAELAIQFGFETCLVVPAVTFLAGAVLLGLGKENIGTTAVTISAFILAGTACGFAWLRVFVKKWIDVWLGPPTQQEEEALLAQTQPL